jgi:uncharacterized protein (TIGR02001 family)
MKKILQGVVVSCGLMAAPAFADDAIEYEVSANIGMVSKYVWRGWNLNDSPSAQGGFDLSANGFTVGTWGGTDENLGTEIDYFVGYGTEINEYVAIDVGWIQYKFEHLVEDVEEFHVTLDFNFFSTTYHRGEDGYNYVEFNSTFELNEKFSIDFHYGFEDNDVNEWNDYQLKLNYTINDNYSLFIAGSEKEKHDSHIYAGLMAVF